MVLRGAGGRAFVAGTDINQFADFETGEDGVEYERRIDSVLDRLEAVRKPTVALVDGVAMGSGFAIAASCDLRVMHAGRDVRDADRAHGRQLPVDGQLRAARRTRSAPRGVKDLIFTRARDRTPTRRSRSASSARSCDDAEAHVTELCELLAAHSQTTLWVTKEALRRARVVPEGDDLVLEAYGSEGFRANVARFLKR